MQYIFNSLEEIQKVYVPKIKAPQDDFLKNIDLHIFQTELIELLLKKEGDFISEIDKDLKTNNNSILFEINLEKKVKEIEYAINKLEELTNEVNKIDKILINYHLKSYENVIRELKFSYSKYINNKDLFYPKFKNHKNKDGKYNEELFNHIIRGNKIHFKESIKEKTNTIWFEIGKLIAIGEIEFRKQNNGIDIYYKGNKQENGSKLAEELTQVIDYKKDSIKAYINDTKSNLMIHGRKNIFISLKNANKLMKYCTDNNIKPSDYLTEKIKELEYSESLK